MYFSVLEAEKSKLKVPANLISGEGLLLRSKLATFSLCAAHLVKEQGREKQNELLLSLVSFLIRTQILPLRDPHSVTSFNLITSLQAHLQYSHSGG